MPAEAWLAIQDDEAPRAPFPFYAGFESGVWSNYWTVRTNGPGRIRLLNPTNGFEGNRSLAMDAALLSNERLWFHPCVNTLSVEMDTQDFLRRFLPGIGRNCQIIAIEE